MLVITVIFLLTVSYVCTASKHWNCLAVFYIALNISIFCCHV